MYAASAAMEWAGERNEAIPRNIFELGLKAHIGVPGTSQDNPPLVGTKRRGFMGRGRSEGCIIPTNVEL